MVVHGHVCCCKDRLVHDVKQRECRAHQCLHTKPALEDVTVIAACLVRTGTSVQYACVWHLAIYLCVRWDTLILGEEAED